MKAAVTRNWKSVMKMFDKTIRDICLWNNLQWYFQIGLMCLIKRETSAMLSVASVEFTSIFISRVV